MIRDDAPPWRLSAPDVAMHDGKAHRHYWLAFGRRGGRTLALATLAVCWWLAPRDRWGTVDVEVGP